MISQKGEDFIFPPAETEGIKCVMIGVITIAIGRATIIPRLPDNLDQQRANNTALPPLTLHASTSARWMSISNAQIGVVGVVHIKKCSDVSGGENAVLLRLLPVS